jgi:hypothetical protein
MEIPRRRDIVTPKKTRSRPTLDRTQLADLIERHADEAIPLVLAALRGEPVNTAVVSASAAESSVPSEPASVAPTQPAPATVNGRHAAWRQVDVIGAFTAVWPAPQAWRAQGHSQLREHYGPMHVYETIDQHGPVRIALGEPRERLPLYGRERGWVSLWHVVNGRPQRQLANFVEVDDFGTTRERAALISGKDGAAKKGFSPGDEHLLPPAYQSMRIEVQRDRLVGANSRNRLVVVATDDDVTTMLDHALAHLHLRQ